MQPAIKEPRWGLLIVGMLLLGYIICFVLFGFLIIAFSLENSFWEPLFITITIFAPPVVTFFVVYIVDEEYKSKKSVAESTRKEQEREATINRVRQEFGVTLSNYKLGCALEEKRWPFDTAKKRYRAIRLLYWNSDPDSFTRKYTIPSQYGKFWERDELPISGHEAFRRSVKRVLQELRDKAPDRYEEVIHFLPKAEFTTTHSGFSGRSDGLFTIDGTGHYEDFRWIFLHEVGHNYYMEQANPYGADLFRLSSEDLANSYVRDVLRDMGIK